MAIHQATLTETRQVRLFNRPLFRFQRTRQVTTATHTPVPTQTITTVNFTSRATRVSLTTSPTTHTQLLQAQLLKLQAQQHHVKQQQQKWHHILTRLRTKKQARNTIPAHLYSPQYHQNNRLTNALVKELPKKDPTAIPSVFAFMAATTRPQRAYISSYDWPTIFNPFKSTILVENGQSLEEALKKQDVETVVVQATPTDDAPEVGGQETDPILVATEVLTQTETLTGPSQELIQVISTLLITYKNHIKAASELISSIQTLIQPAPTPDTPTTADDIKPLKVIINQTPQQPAQSIEHTLERLSSSIDNYNTQTDLLNKQTTEATQALESEVASLPTPQHSAPTQPIMPNPSTPVASTVAKKAVLSASLTALTKAPTQAAH